MQTSVAAQLEFVKFVQEFFSLQFCKLEEVSNHRQPGTRCDLRELFRHFGDIHGRRNACVAGFAGEGGDLIYGLLHHLFGSMFDCAGGVRQPRTYARTVDKRSAKSFFLFHPLLPWKSMIFRRSTYLAFDSTHRQ